MTSEQLIIFAANDLPWLEGLALGLLGLGVLRWPRGREAILLIVVNALSAWSLTALIKAVYESPRPFVGLPAGSTLLTYGGLESFPSGHATFFFAIAFALYGYHRRLGDAALLLAVVISAARVLAGLHWSLDVAGGAAIAALSTLIWFSFRRRLRYNQK